MELKTSKSSSSSLLNCLLNIFIPLRCVLCQQSAQHPLSLCSACKESITSNNQLTSPFDDNTNLHPEPWDNLRYLATYDAPVKELIQQAKFSHKLAIFKVLGQLLADQIHEQGFDSTLTLIPVPLHKKRLIERGYNQAMEISLPLAKTLKLSINNHSVHRVIESKTQHFLTKQQRHCNAQQLFQVEASVPKNVAVIDDIFTTGATMRSICTCLKNAGVQNIEVWIIARTLKQSSGILSP